MLKVSITTVALLSLLSSSINAAFAIDGTAGATGAQCRGTYRTGGSMGWTAPTGPQRLPLPRATTGRLAPDYSGSFGLPPTRLDSFVKKAGGLANQIYGDEGTTGPPKIEHFNPQNRIDFGITNSENNFGLTTGHESLLPSAWGSDEFSSHPEGPTVSGDHVLRDEFGIQINVTVDPMGAMPGGVVGGGYFDISVGEFPGASGK